MTISIILSYSLLGFKGLTPRGDQEIIYPYNINTVASKQAVRKHMLILSCKGLNMWSPTP